VFSIVYLLYLERLEAEFLFKMGEVIELGLRRPPTFFAGELVDGLVNTLVGLILKSSSPLLKSGSSKYGRIPLVGL